jgi:glycosyltransferase involved in cell wall biosynthesis
MARRPRVAFVAPAVPGREERNGFSSRLHDLLLALVRVADVDLFLPRTADAESPGAVERWRGVDGITLHLTLDAPTRSGIAHRIALVGHHVFGRLPRWSTPRRAPELAQHLAAGGADVLCLHLPVTAHLAVLAPPDVPVIAVLEEGLERSVLAPQERSWLHSQAARLEQRRVERLYRRTGDVATTVVAISTGERDHLAASGVRRDRIVVVPHGVDTSYFEPADPVSEPEYDVGVFAELRFARNLNPARDAFLWSTKHHPDLRWAFVGAIEPADADDLRAAGATVTGRVDDLRPHYASTNVVLVPAVAVTGVKTTLLQAWAMGNPVVTTPESSIGVPAVDGVNLLVGRSTPELVERCAELVASSDLRDQIAAAGRETVCATLDSRSIAATFAELVVSVATVD